MAKQLNINLAFSSDTTKVKQDLQDLQNTLNRLTTNSAQKSPLGITTEIKNAVADVTKLEIALKNATTTTGSLNLSRFKQELNQAGLNAEKISLQLRTLGPEGAKAFAQLTNSIMKASIPLRQTGTLLTNFATTLKNTARWQISSAILHKFIGSIQTAYTYAQNLNKSLNNIRIVTGKSTEEMADFAKEANEAAQALSTTTTEYTNASLIYYQQGLDDEAVKERTDATVKMANVTRESAEEVSQQMTAIWNNFDNGSKSLEYYSDVITALGAATASSSAEIAQGLEKFASVADTVGLSYEYATAALATVTATTRQSADVVGNAFKTIFARLEGLKLGETLEDDTDLNKYSKALDSVGISIKNTDGELKQMDQILDELGARWQTLSKDQQVALAQTIAGVRQYTQLVALMNEWDFFEQNVRIAKDSEGTLQKQFKIYEESWDAAKKRSTAAMQEIYTQIFNDKFFIGLTNAFTKITQSIGKVIESFGGLQGLLPGISALLLRMFGPELTASLDRFATNLKIRFSNTLESMLQERQAFATKLQSIQSDRTISGSAIADVYKEQGNLQDILIVKVRELQANHTTLSEQEQEHINKLMEFNSILGETKIKEAEKLETLQRENEALQRQVMLKADQYKNQDSNFNKNNFKEELDNVEKLQIFYANLNELRQQYNNINNDEQGVENLKKIITEMQNLSSVTNIDIEEIQELQRALENLSNAKGPEERVLALEEFETQLDLLGGKAADAFVELRRSISGDSQEAKELKNLLDQLYEGFTKLGIQIPKAAIAGNNFAQSAKLAGNIINEASGKVITASERFVAFGSSLSSFAMTLRSVTSIINTIENPDLSSWEKFLNITMSLGFLIPSVIRTWTQLNTLLRAQTTIMDVIHAKNAAHQADLAKEIALRQANIASIKAEESAKVAEKIQEEFIKALREENIALALIEDGERKQRIIELGREYAARNLNLSAMSSEDQRRTIGNLLASQGIVLKEEEISAIIKEAIAIEMAKKLKEADTIATVDDAAASAADAAMKEAEAEATLRAGKAHEIHAKSLLATPWGWVLAVVAAVAAGFLIYSNNLDDVIEAQKRAAKESSELAKNLKDEVEEHKELINSYEDLIKKYKDNEIEKSELYDVTNKLASSYDIEGSAIANLTGQYDELTKKIKAARAEEIERQKEAEKKAYKENVKNMWAESTTGTGRIAFAGKGYIYDPISSAFYAGNEYGTYYSQAVKDVTGKNAALGIENRNDPKQVLEYYETLQKVRDTLINKYGRDEATSQEILDLDKELEQMSGSYEQAIEHLNNYNNLLLQEIGNTKDIANVQNINEVENIANEMKEKLKEENPDFSEEEIDNLINEYLQNLGNEVINKFLAQKELLLEGVPEEVAKAFLDLNLPENEIKTMMTIGFDYNDYETKEELEKAVKNFQTLIDANNDTTYISLPVLLNINEKINKGKDLTKNEWDELKEQVPNAEDILGDKDSFNNKSIAERLQLMRKLNEVIEKQNKAVVESLPEQREAQEKIKKDLEDKIKLKQKEFEQTEKEIELEEKKLNNKLPSDVASKFESDDLKKLKEDAKETNDEINQLIQSQEALDEYLREMDDAGYSHLQTRINDVLTDVQSLQSAVELIGDAWIVAAEDVDVFAQMFPKLAAQAEHLEDGTLSFASDVNKKLLADTLNANAEIIKSNKEVVVQQIDDKLIQLRAEQEFLQNKKIILEQTLNGEKSEKEAAAALNKIYADYKEKLEKDGVENHAKAASEATNATAIMSNNLITSLSKVNEAVIKLNDNISKIGSGDDLDKIQIGDAVGEVISGNIDELVKPQEMDKETFEAVKKDLEDTTTELSMVSKQISSLEGSRAKILEGFTNYNEAVNRVNSGKAGKAEKDKKSSSSNKPDKKDLIILEDELDKYYDINNAISKINQELERQEQIQKRLSTFQEHYAGKTLIASLKKQNDLLKQKNNLLSEQYKNYEKLYEIQMEELGELKGKIGGQWNGNELLNYAELFQANVDKYNEAITAYNAMSKDQQQNTGKDMIEDAKKVYDKYKEALERYQTLYYNEMYDTENQLAELRQRNLENQMEIIENNLKGWETEVQLKLDMTGLKRDWKAFIKDVEQDFRKIYENLSLESVFGLDSFNTYVEDAETRLQQIADVEAELRKMDASKDANGVVQISDDMMFGSISEAQEYLKNLQKELVDVGNSLNDMYKQVWDNYIKGLDQAKDNFEDINKELEHLTGMLEYEKELIELIYGEKAYDLMNKYYETQQNNIETRIDSTRQQAQFWEDQFNKAFEMNRDKHNVDLNDMSTWTEDMRKAYDEMIEAQEELNDLVIEGINNLKDEYLNNVAKTLSEMDKAIWGMDFEDLKEDWDFLQKKADEYLDDVEGAYKIQELANKISESIEKTSDPKAQQKLAKLREDELKMLREKEHLTQDDIDLAEARYQIALKEIALEEAQNNKTSMKLTRDTSGNWTYQYVADEEDVADKRQDLLDAYNNLYETADNAYQHAMELAMDMYEEYKDKLLEIAEDITLTEEEKLQKMRELQDQYLPEIEAAVINSQVYQQETIMAAAAVFKEVCDQDADNYTALTDLQKELVDMVRDQHLQDYEEIREAILNNYQEIGDKAKEVFEETNINSQTAASDIINQWDGDENSFKKAMNDALDSVIDYTKNFEDELRNLEEVSGKTIMDSGGVVEDINAIGEAIDTASYKTQDMVNTAEAYLDDLRKCVDEVERSWEDVINRIQDAIDALWEYLNMSEAVSAEEARREAEAAKRAADEARQSSSSSGSGSGSGGSSGGGSGVAGEERSGTLKLQTDPYGVSGTIGLMDENGKYVAITKSDRKSYEELLRRYSDYNITGTNLALIDSITKRYDTGGYTGDWDSQSGKLAFLHQKELVLNASDTENMLSAVNTIRDIAGLNESISKTIAESIGSLIIKAISAGSGDFSTTTNDNTNNVFNITAEFPNANDVQTIKDAILSLPNIASQYVHMN